MSIMRSVIAAAAITAGFAGATSPAWAQAYPSRPIHLIVNFAPRGAGDILGRIIGDQLSIEMHQSVVVEDRPGAGGTVGARDVVNAPPDGYTLTVAQTPEIAINPYLLKNVGYDPLKDLQPVALAGVMPLVLTVSSKSPYANVAQWVAALRANQAMTFASAGVGTPGHLAGEMLKLKLDNKLVHMPYKSAESALKDVAAGQVDFYFPAYPTAVPPMQRGRVRLLAVSTVERSPLSPDIPTVAEATGIANFDFPLWVGFFGPHGMPIDVTKKLNTEINKILLEPAINARLRAFGPQVSALSIDQFAAFVRTDIAQYRQIIDELLALELPLRQPGHAPAVDGGALE